MVWKAHLGRADWVTLEAMDLGALLVELVMNELKKGIVTEFIEPEDGVSREVR
jgi:hypothetical protein